MKALKKIDKSISCQSIAKLRKSDKEYENFLHATICLLIANCCEFCGRELSDEIIQDTSQIIMKRYYYLSVDELSEFFQLVKSGEYGETRFLTGQVIMMFLARYAINRMKKMEKQEFEKSIAEREMFVKNLMKQKNLNINKLQK